MPRFLKTRTQSWSSVSSQATMDSARPQSSNSNSEASRSRQYDTGFPESFCGTGNTTLRYPGADTSGNATISANDIKIEQAITRTKTRFLAKHKHTVKYGKIRSEMSFGSRGLTSGSHTSSDLSSMDSIHDESRLSKSGEFNRPSTSNSSQPFADTASPDSPHRRGLLSKFKRHH